MIKIHNVVVETGKKNLKVYFNKRDLVFQINNNTLLF